MVGIAVGIAVGGIMRIMSGMGQAHLSVRRWAWYEGWDDRSGELVAMGKMVMCS